MGQNSSKPKSTKFSKVNFEESNVDSTERKEADEDENPEKTNMEKLKKHLDMINSSKEVRQTICNSIIMIIQKKNDVIKFIVIL